MAYVECRGNWRSLLLTRLARAIYQQNSVELVGIGLSASERAEFRRLLVKTLGEQPADGRASGGSHTSTTTCEGWEIIQFSRTDSATIRGGIGGGRGGSDPMTLGKSPCANGHLAPPGGSFCTRCGAALVSGDVAEPPVTGPLTAGSSAGFPPQPPTTYSQGSYTGVPPAQRAYPYIPVESRAVNGMAITSMVLGILWIYWIGSILALVFGYVALNQIKTRNENGRGMAIAGVVLGWVGAGILVLVIIAGAASNS